MIPKTIWTIEINRVQPHTQSPSALVSYYAGSERLVASGLQSHPQNGTLLPETPLFQVIYHSEGLDMTPWEATLSSLNRLKDGWNGYDAPAPSQNAIATAKSFIGTLLKENHEPKRVVASAAGGVGVTRRSDKRKVFVEFFNDGKVFALFSDGESEPVSKEVQPSFQSFKKLSREMQEYLDA